MIIRTHNLIFSFVLSIVLVGCDVDSTKFVDKEIEEILLRDNLTRNSFRINQLQGIEGAKETLMLADSCFNYSRTFHYRPYEIMALMRYSSVKAHGEEDIRKMLSCVGSSIDGELDLYFLELVGSIPSKNTPFFKIIYNELFREYRPEKEGMFNLLENAIYYCNEEIIRYLVDDDYELNFNLWNEPMKFRKFYNTVCEFDQRMKDLLNDQYK